MYSVNTLIGMIVVLSFMLQISLFLTQTRQTVA